MVVMNVLACNTDAHAKNYSIMIRAGRASLAPMYDLMCGEVWEHVTKTLAQKLAGESRGDYLKRGTGSGLPASAASILSRLLTASARWQNPSSRSFKSLEAIQSRDPLGAPRKLRRRRLSFLQGSVVAVAW
jgi:hypothetical protein